MNWRSERRRQAGAGGDCAAAAVMPPRLARTGQAWLPGFLLAVPASIALAIPDLAVVPASIPLAISATMAVPASIAYATAPVAVDIGHSKPHPGATSARGKPEFEFNRELGRVIAQTLQAQQMPAVLIGEEGGMVNLPDRTALASRLHAGFLLSVHHDSAQPQYLQNWLWQGAPQHFSDRFSGYSLFVSRKNPQLETSLHCARLIGQALQQAGLHASEHHAEPIAGENREWADRPAGVYYFDDLLVLKTAAMPALLLEAGVIINREEEQWLLQSSTRKTIATAVAQGLAQCGALPAAVSAPR